MRIRNRHINRTASTLVDDDFEVELQHEACEYSLLTEQVGNMLVVAYLAPEYDGGGINPMKDYDGQGYLYTDGSDHVITDDPTELKRALRLRGGRWCDDQPELDHEFVLDGKRTTLWDLAAEQFFERLLKEEDLRQKWVEHLKGELEEGETYTFVVEDLRRDLYDANGVYSEEIEELAIDLYSKHWESVVGPFVIPVDYIGNNHGPGTTTIGVTNWDGDWREPPNAVWVACKSAEENLRYGGNKPDAELRKAAEEYAGNVLSEYASWCNGDVYGCVVEVFQNMAEPGDEPDWQEAGDHDSCWGYIGSEWAEQALKEEHFEPTVNKLKKELGLLVTE